MSITTREAMKKARRWLLWRPNSEGRKIPDYVNGKPRSGTLDTPEEIAQLVTYPEAVAALKVAGQGYDLGFALGPDGTGNFWHAIDFDNVDASGTADLVNAAPGYVERSPSGQGAHAIGYGLQFDNLGSDGSGIEAYASGRYFTFTEEIIRNGELCDLSSFVSELVPRRKMPLPARHVAANDAPAIINDSIAKDVNEALFYIKADSYDIWIKIGLALKTLGEIIGFPLFMEWSKRSPNFNNSEAEKKWNSFNPINTSHKVIFTVARENGWKNPGYSQDCAAG